MIVLTGVAGLFGANFVRYLLSETEEDIVGIDSLLGGQESHLPQNNRFRFLKGDLSDTVFQKDVEPLFRENSVSYVFHFAAYAAEGLSPFIRCFNYKNNVIATAFITNMCIQYNVKRLVFTSSIAVYGDQIPPFEESMTPRPMDPYGVAKYCSEMDIQIAAAQHGLEYCILRPHNVYGPYQNIWDPYRNALGIWMYKSLKGQPITIYGDGLQERAFTYIDDVLPCFWKAAVSPTARNQIINIGGLMASRLIHAADLMGYVTGNRNIVHLEARHEAKYAYSTHDKAIQLLGYQDKTSLLEGIQKMWAWAKEQPDRGQTMWGTYEIDKDMYSFWK